MIRIIAGGKKSSGWIEDGVEEYAKRLKKPYDIKWDIMEEEKLNAFLSKWAFSGNDFVILLDERGKNISSPEFAELLEKKFVDSKNIIIIIGGAFGVSEEVRNRANFVWSYSRLVFPHMLMRIMLAEQIYRASEINFGGKYHHL